MGDAKSRAGLSGSNGQIEISPGKRQEIEKEDQFDRVVDNFEKRLPPFGEGALQTVRF